jgi:predicted phage terminase large subunit-like protein
MATTIDHEKEAQASKLRGSLLEFTRYFFEYITGRQFIISVPISRESHHITCCRALTAVRRLEVLREIINLPPGCGKSTLASMWAAWGWASYPDANYLYISYSHELAAKHTAFIRSIVSSKMYRYLFDVELDPDSRAKDAFKTTAGGSIKAFGSGGAITGQDAGLPGLNRFTGGVILDDAHKPDEAHSETIRQGVINNYDETIRQRCRGVNVPIVYIGQRVHEADLTDFFMSGKDVDEWHATILKGLDEAGNALYPEMMPKEKLLALQEKSPYVFASQYQQDPLPAGGGLFKPEWFVLLDEEPPCHVTFITADTAETNKSWNDATVFSFWGVYEIETMGRKTGEMGLHWIDCMEIRIEPKDLKDAFMDFYANCVMYPKPPLLAAIEKKSTGVTLVSILQELRGMQIRQIERTIASGSKTQRFLEIQPFIASKFISFNRTAKHKENCIKHMGKITANDTHRHDDIADTLADAIRIALIEKTIYSNDNKEVERKLILENMNQSLQRKIRARTALYGGHSQKTY